MKLTRKTYATRQEKTRDFIIGVVLWHLVNALIILPIILVPIIVTSWSVPSTAPDWFEALASACPLIVLFVNIGGLILLGVTRAWIALGALASMGFYFFLSLCAGLIFVGWCFISLATPSGSR